MEPIKSREEALRVMKAFEEFTPDGSNVFSEAMDALVHLFFLTDEQKEEMHNAEYKYALQIGIDPVFAKYFYGYA